MAPEQRGQAASILHRELGRPFGLLEQVDDLAAVVAAAGLESGRPTIFVWEAVTPYLTEEAVRATFAFLAKAPANGRLIVTFVRADFLDGTLGTPEQQVVVQLGDLVLYMAQAKSVGGFAEPAVEVVVQVLTGTGFTWTPLT